MICDTLNRAGRYLYLSERFQKAFEYLANTDLNALAAGRYDIDGNDVYLMIQEPELKPWAEGRWEAHRLYADIQLILEGTECIGFRFIDGMAVETPYAEASDILFYDASAPGANVQLEAGDFMILFPEDAHRPCTLPECGASKVRKAVVKVRLD